MKFNVRFGNEAEDAPATEEKKGNAAHLAAQAGKTALEAGKAVHRARKSAARMAGDASYVIRHARTNAGKAAAGLRKDAEFAWKARKLDYMERREKARRTALARERAKAREKAKAQAQVVADVREKAKEKAKAQAQVIADVREKGREKVKARTQAMADYRTRARAKDREKTRALWKERSYRMPSLSFIPAMLYSLLALWNLTNGSRKKSWIYHITGMLTLFIAGMYFFLDFTVRRTDDL